MLMAYLYLGLFMFLANPYVTVPGSKMERRIKRSLHHHAIQCFSIDFFRVDDIVSCCDKPKISPIVFYFHNIKLLFKYDFRDFFTKI